MSAAPLDPDQVPQEVKDGLVSGVLGSLAMAARLLLSAEPVTLGWVIRRVAAAGITALFVGYFLQEHVSSVPLRYAIIGVCGYSAPEVADYAARWLKAKMGNEVAKAEKKKPDAKKPGKRRR
jgi:hypothetical protein